MAALWLQVFLESKRHLQLQMWCHLLAQVEWQDANDPAKGFQYLYLTDADHARLTSTSQRLTLQVVNHARKARSCCVVASQAVLLPSNRETTIVSFAWRIYHSHHGKL